MLTFLVPPMILRVVIMLVWQNYYVVIEELIDRDRSALLNGIYLTEVSL